MLGIKQYPATVEFIEGYIKMKDQRRGEKSD